MSILQSIGSSQARDRAHADDDTQTLQSDLFLNLVVVLLLLMGNGALLPDVIAARGSSDGSSAPPLTIYVLANGIVRLESADSEEIALPDLGKSIESALERRSDREVAVLRSASVGADKTQAVLEVLQSLGNVQCKLGLLREN